ncbi:MAG: 4-(cytidine 5'-diphospho)-2-C-methyl-D-erythritol kinase [Patescibacteria group bacterium]
MTKLACPAKVTLFLAIHERDSNGYHQIETIMARAPQLEDFLIVEKSDRATLDAPSLPSGENNTVVKALRVLEKATGKDLLYSIQIEKNIPIASGLGGGSSNAAALMIYLNEVDSLGIPHLDLIALGAQVGMDVPFFISGSPVALCTHYGEVVTGLPNLPKELKFEIHDLGIQNSTKEAYELWDKKGLHSAKNSRVMQEALLHEDAQAVLAALHNDFEQIYPLPSILRSKSLGVPLLSGSGAAVVVFDV